MANDEAEVSTQPTFNEELRVLLNRHCKENGSNTPDFILADYMRRALESFDKAVQEREHWYGRRGGN